MARVLHNKETSDIEKRVAEIESRLRRMQRTSLIKNIIYVIIVIGVAFIRIQALHDVSRVEG